MTLYAEINGDVLVKYPYTFADMQEENPYTNFGGNYDVAFWFPKTQTALNTGYSLVEVTYLTQPDYEHATHSCLPDAEPKLVDGEWFIGWTLTKFTDEELAAKVEQWRQSAVVTPFQGRMALADAELLSDVEAAVAAADAKTQVAWEYALEWKRLSPMIATLGAALNLTDAEIDDLFKAAAEISA
jgi:hypothetical protein